MEAASSRSFRDIPAPPVISDVEVDEIVREYSSRSASLSDDDGTSALRTILSCIDLTTLEGNDTADRIRGLCARASEPHPSLPSVAAVCVYGPLVRVAKMALQGSSVRVASVSASFPSGMAPLNLKVKETEYVVAEGADEVDMVISRGAFLEGREEEVFEEILAIRAACGNTLLKVILETGELGTASNIRRASDIALYAGADFIKTSTGKTQPGATPSAAVVMLQAVRDFERATGRKVGFKPAGGVAAVEDALKYYLLVKELCGPEWLTPSLFRVGASRLLDTILTRIL